MGPKLVDGALRGDGEEDVNLGLLLTGDTIQTDQYFVRTSQGNRSLVLGLEDLFARRVGFPLDHEKQEGNIGSCNGRQQK